MLDHLANTTCIDDSIPATLACTSPETVLESCREQLTKIAPEVRDSWKSARLIEALYHPCRSLRVAYALLADPDTPSNRLWPEAQIVYLHTPLREPMSRRGTPLHIGGVEVEAYRFPNDRRLRGLRSFAGRTSTVEVWQRWLEQQGRLDRLEPSSLQRLLVRYVPEQKWIIRLRAESSKPSTSSTKKLRVAVRCARPEAIDFLRKVHDRLAMRPSSEDSTFRIPSVIGVTDDRTILGMEWLRGSTLIETIRENGADDVLRSLAERLVAFHRVVVDGIESVTPRSLVDRLTNTKNHLTNALSGCRADIQTVTESLSRRIERLQTGPLATLHNDFHFGQVTIKRETYVLHDLDRMAIGDPMIDVANFAVQLSLLGDRPEFGVEADEAASWRDTFLDQWACVTGSAPPRERLACYSALSALELASGMMRHLREGWRRLAGRCIETAATQLETGASKIARIPSGGEGL